jgi:predicted MFS family arabinose efflux permease
MWSGLKGLPRECWILFWAALVNRTGTMAIPFLVLYLTTELGIPPSRAGFLLALFGIGSLAMAPVSGWLCDRVGPLLVMRASLLSSGVVMLLYPLARTFPSLVAMTLLWSLTGELFRPASLAVISGLVPADKRKAAFALNRLAINLGMSVGPAAGGFLAAFSFPLIFRADGATTLLAGLVLLVAWRASSGSQPTRSEAPATGRAMALADGRLAYFLVALVPAAVVFFQHESAMSLFLVRDLGLRESSYGLLFTLNTLLIVALEVPLNGAMAGWSHRATLTLGALLIGCGFGAMAAASGMAGAALSVVVWTFGEMVLLPGMAAYVADISPEDRRGAYMGLYVMAFNSAFAIGPWLGMHVLETLGARPLWLGCVAAGALSAALFIRIRQPERPA